MVVAIEFKNISKSYGKNNIIHDLNLKINEGEFLTIIGSSGCGKTTLLKMINQLIKPEVGEILVNGENISEQDIISLRRNIGYSVQGNVLFPHLTVEENISYVPHINKDNPVKTKETVTKWMNIIGLPEEYLTHYPFELSGGEKQRVGIARALAKNPHILLMDEPFSAVDAITRTQLQKEIKNIHEKTGITIVFVTHDINEALNLGTKVLIMENGGIEQYDTPENIIKAPSTMFAKKLINGVKILEQEK
jgi:osmoprotectant transport system ATP-binding protein